MSDVAVAPVSLQVVLPRSWVSWQDQLWQQTLAQATEQCGLLGGAESLADGDRTLQVQSWLTTANVAGDRRQQFRIDPVEFLAAHQQLIAQGQRHLGFFHSHPHGDARPSPHDQATARLWPGHLFVIVAGALPTGDALAWYLARASGLEPIPWSLEV